jgi:hypothetical protein
MKRREFIAGLGGTVVRPMVARRLGGVAVKAAPLLDVHLEAAALRGVHFATALDSFGLASGIPFVCRYDLPRRMIRVDSFRSSFGRPDAGCRNDSTGFHSFMPDRRTRDLAGGTGRPR